MKNVMRYLLCAVGLMLTFAGISFGADATPLESAVSSIGTTATSITGSTVAGAVVLSALGLFAIKFGTPWVIGLFKRVAK